MKKHLLRVVFFIPVIYSFLAAGARTFLTPAPNDINKDTRVTSGKNATPGQAPNITYPGGTQTYPVGTAVSLSPVNTGGAVPATIYGQVTTLAGSGTNGSANGTGTAASFTEPTGVAVDAAGNVYVADAGNQLIRKITPAGVVSMLAGSGAQNGTFSYPHPTYSHVGLAVDATGNVYVADTFNHLIRKITPAGVVSIFAGDGNAGNTNGTGTAASFSLPHGLAIDAAGNVYVADEANNLIRKITPAGVVSTLAGAGIAGHENGTGAAASFYAPTGVAVDAAGNVYVADSGDNLIRKITAAGVVSTLAGSGASGKADGAGTAASFRNPWGISVDAADNVYVADLGNQVIRKISPAGIVSTLAGSGSIGNTNGIGASSSFSNPFGVTADAAGNVYVADRDYGLIRKITATGYTISAVLPAGLSFDVKTGIISGTPAAASPAANYTITAYNAGGNSTATVSIAVNTAAPVTQAPNITYAGGAQTYTVGTAITTLSPNNSGGAVPANFYGLVSTFAGSSAYGNANGTGKAAIFGNPEGVAADAAGNVYVADSDNNLIRKITPAGVVTTLAGSGTQGNANGTGTAASFSSPFGIAVDAAGNVYVADTDNNLVRKITPAGIVSTLAGSGAAGSSNGTGTTATFMGPTGITVDAAGNVYVAEEGNNLIRKITQAGVVSTLAGSGAYGNANGTGANASFHDPLGLATDAAGNVYVADAGNNLIRKISPAGTVSTLAGSGAEGKANGTGTAASFGDPEGVAVDAAGNVYVVEEENGLIRKITPAGVVSTVAGTGQLAYTDGEAISASFHNPIGIAIDGAGNAYVADKDNNVIRKLTTTGYTIKPALPAGLKFDDMGNITGTPTAATPAAAYTVTAYNAGGSSTITVNITVKAAGQLTFNAIPAKTYGAVDFNPGATAASGALISYTSSNTAVASIVSGKIHIKSAGTTKISASDGSKTLTQQLTVNPAPLTITADDQTRVYGAANPNLTVSYSGFVNGDTHDNLTVQPSAATNATLASGVNTYPITVSGAASGNYSITYMPGALTILAAPAPRITFHTLAAVTYGSADITPVASSTNTFTPVTYISSNTSVAVITPGGTIRINGAGSTTITASQGASANYEAGAPVYQTLKVSPATLTVTAGDQAKVYGTANPALTISYTGFVNQDTKSDLTIQPAISSTATTASPVGTYPVTASGGASSNYTFAYASGTLTVTPATLTITAENKSKYYGDVNPPLTISYSGFVNGDSQASLSTQATAATTAALLSATGNYPITVYGATAANYSITFVPGKLAIKPAPAPAITAISNNEGILGATVEITGSYLLNTTAVKFGGVPVLSFTVNSATSITATIGAGASGSVSVTTPSGTGTISGFTYFLSLPANNFKLAVTSVTCKGSNNGSVNITAAKTLNYTAAITGNGVSKSYNFTNSANINDLASGSYSVCITVANQSNYQQCFDIVITEPKDLSLFSAVNTADKTLNLTLDGGDTYNIKLNDKLYTTTANTIRLPLNEGNNTLEVTTDRLCQGLIRKIITISGIVIPYPDPFDDVLNVNLGSANINNLVIEIHRLSDGKLVFSQQYVNQSGNLKLDVSNLKRGIYALKLASANMEKIFKVLKK